MAYSALLIADYFLANSAKPLTAMHLIKLTYIAHGFVLAFTKQPLIDERVEAWKYGPVIPALYHAYKGSGGRDIRKLEYCGTELSDKEIGARREFLKSRIGPKISNVLDQIIDIYGSKSALELSALTHKPGTPWDQCRTPNELFTLIPNGIIQEHYERKVEADGESGH